MSKKTVFSDKQKNDIVRMYEETHSLRMTANAFNTNHRVLSKFLKSQGIPVLSREEAAKYVWKNHKHPHTGKTGKDSYAYGHKMSDETREKLKPIWAANAAAQRFEKKKHSDGYILVYCPEHPCSDRGGFVLEHRLVIEKELGRTLSKDEYVHHINGDKADNRLENLMLTNRSEHAKIHMKLRYKKDA